MDVDRDTLFDLIAAINDNRRFLAAQALHSPNSARKSQCQRVSHLQATAVSRITRDLARHDKRHASMPSRQLEIYIDSLIDAYLDDSDDPLCTGVTAPSLRRTGG